MLGVLACPTGPAIPLDPWVVFREETLQPFLDQTLVVGALALLALTVTGLLLIGIASELSPRDRSACAAVPTFTGVTLFVVIQLGARPLGAWWNSRGAALHDALLATALAVTVLGALVQSRPLFFQRRA